MGKGISFQITVSMEEKQALIRREASINGETRALLFGQIMEMNLAEIQAHGKLLRRRSVKPSTGRQLLWPSMCRCEPL